MAIYLIVRRAHMRVLHKLQGNLAAAKAPSFALSKQVSGMAYYILPKAKRSTPPNPSIHPQYLTMVRSYLTRSHRPNPQYSERHNALQAVKERRVELFNAIEAKHANNNNSSHTSHSNQSRYALFK